jgi:hypothetical protein
MNSAFIIFKEARRFKAGFLDDLGDVKTFTFQKRDYHFVGQCPFYHHITNAQNQLIGFAVDMVTHYVKESGLLPWIQEAENVLYEMDTALFYIHWPYPTSGEHDGASLVAANFYYDDNGNFLITLWNAKASGKDGQFQNLWTEITFPVAPAEQFIVKEYFPKNEKL